MDSLSFIFPGQGAQYPGMGKSFFETFSEAREVFQEADDILARPLSKTIFSGSEGELTETRTSQPAIFVTSIAILRAIERQFNLRAPSSTCGLSLGEYTALVAAGYIDFAAALKLVARRGAFMHEACEENKGSMKVVLGLSDEAVENAIRDLNMPNDIWCANFNCPGQVVVSGTEKGLDAAETALKACGAKRVLPLQVHGAFHSGLMASAQKRLSPYIQKSPFLSSSIPVAMNVSGRFETDHEKIRSLLIQQVTSPVRWHRDIASCVEHGTSGFIEMGPGKTLAGMNKRNNIQQPTVSIETVDDLAHLETLLLSRNNEK